MKYIAFGQSVDTWKESIERHQTANCLERRSFRRNYCRAIKTRDLASWCVNQKLVVGHRVSWWLNTMKTKTKIAVTLLVLELLCHGVKLAKAQRTYARQGVSKDPPTVTLPLQGTLAGKEVGCYEFQNICTDNLSEVFCQPTNDKASAISSMYRSRKAHNTDFGCHNVHYLPFIRSASFSTVDFFSLWNIHV